jgi:hypothetical protein
MSWYGPVLLQDAEERQAEALEIALLNRAAKQRGGGFADGDGSPGALLAVACVAAACCRPPLTD